MRPARSGGHAEVVAYLEAVAGKVGGGVNEVREEEEEEVGIGR